MRLNSPKQQLAATYLEVPRSANSKEAAPKNSKRRHSHNLRGSRGANKYAFGRKDQAVYTKDLHHSGCLLRNTRSSFA